MSGFYTAHPVTLTKPEPTGGCQPLLPVHPFQFANEPSLASGYVSNSRPASALELKRRLFRLACWRQPPERQHLPAMSAPPAEAFGVAAPSTRRSPPPGRAANAATNLPLPANPPWNRHDLPKVATTVPRMPSLPFASAPTSEDMAAGNEPPARHGLTGGRLRRRSGYPPRCAQRPGANGPSEERGSEEPTPSTDLTCPANPPLSEDSGRYS